MLESNKSNILLKKKLDEYDLANKRFQESLNKKAAQIRNQTEIERLVKQLQVMRVEIDFQRAEAIQLIQVVDGQQLRNSKKVYMPSCLMPIHGIGKIMKNIPSLM